MASVCCIAYAAGRREAAVPRPQPPNPRLLMSSIRVDLGKDYMCWQAPAAHSCRHQQAVGSFFRQHPPAAQGGARSAPGTAPPHQQHGPVQRSAAHPAAPGNAGLSLDPMQTRPCRDCADRSKAAAVPLRRDSGHKARRLRQPLQMQVVTGAAASRSRLQ